MGVWPKNNETKQDKLISNIRIILLLSISICGCLIPSVHSLFEIWGDIMVMIDNLQFTLPMIMSIIKLSLIWLRKKGNICICILWSIMWYNNKKLFSILLHLILKSLSYFKFNYNIHNSVLIADILLLLNILKNDWLKPKVTHERDVMTKYAQMARILTIIEYFIMLASFILVVILPIFGITIRYSTNETALGRFLPVQANFIYNRERSPYYEISYILQSLGLSAMAFMYSSIDSFLGMLVFHTCGQLENLKTRITYLDIFQHFESALSYNVQDHIRLIRLRIILLKNFCIFFLFFKLKLMIIKYLSILYTYIIEMFLPKFKNWYCYY